MRHLMHDGPKDEIYIRNGELHTPFKPKASLAALSWAAERAGQSYGAFTQGLTEEDEIRIQIEYDEMRRQRTMETARRAAERRSVQDDPPADGFIITDDDA